MDLCPDTLDITLDKNFKDPPSFFMDRVLVLSDFFQQFIKSIGKAVAAIRGEQRYFTAKNGVIIEMDSAVCDMAKCMEDDGIQKVFRYLQG